MQVLDDRPRTRAWQLLWVLLTHPRYHVILADDSEYPGTNWTWTFEVIVNKQYRTISFKGACG
jgi:hypothetical protein